MKKKILILFFCFVLLTNLFLVSQRAKATLGESIDSIETDRRVLAAPEVVSTAYENYTVHQFKYGGVSVREYVSLSGIVFGIAWNGLVYPDLTQLLGSYTGEYQEALGRTVRKHGERHLQVKSDHVVVEKWGHMRNLQGRAYAPDLIPKWVTINEIR